MKAIINKDRRCKEDRLYDDMWNKLCRDAKLTPIQSALVSKYLRGILQMRIHEIESAVDMGWIIALIEREGFGTDVSKGATRLLRVQAYAAEVRNEAYGKGSIDANNYWQKYDGCGLQHLQARLSHYGVEYDTKI